VRGSAAGMQTFLPPSPHAYPHAQCTVQRITGRCRLHLRASAREGTRNMTNSKPVVLFRVHHPVHCRFKKPQRKCDYEHGARKNCSLWGSGDRTHCPGSRAIGTLVMRASLKLNTRSFASRIQSVCISELLREISGTPKRGFFCADVAFPC